MHLNHKPGEVMQVDWAGDTAAVIDTDTGEIIPAYVFVATLPYSGYSYVETFFLHEPGVNNHCPCECLQILRRCHPIIQCDDLKTGVQKHGKDEVVLNKSYQELALLIKHTTTYKGLKPLYSEYKKSRDKEKYLRGREREIILFEASAWALKAAGVGDKPRPWQAARGIFQTVRRKGSAVRRIRKPEKTYAGIRCCQTEHRQHPVPQSRAGTGQSLVASLTFTHFFRVI